MQIYLHIMKLLIYFSLGKTPLVVFLKIYRFRYLLVKLLDQGHIILSRMKGLPLLLKALFL